MLGHPEARVHDFDNHQQSPLHKAMFHLHDLQVPTPTTLTDCWLRYLSEQDSPREAGKCACPLGPQRLDGAPTTHCLSFSLTKQWVKRRGYLTPLLRKEQVQTHEHRDLLSEQMPEGMALAVRVVLCLQDTFPRSPHVLCWLLYIMGISTSVSLATASRVLLLAAHSLFLSL